MFCNLATKILYFLKIYNHFFKQKLFITNYLKKSQSTVIKYENLFNLLLN